MFEISLKSAAIWNPEFYMPIQAGDVPIIQQNIDQLLQHIARMKNVDGLVPLFRFIPNLINSELYPGGDPTALYQKAYDALRSAIKAIRIFNEDLLNTGFKQLTGLGIGLTPSGDDVLAGLFATLIITSNAAHKKWFMDNLGNLLPQIAGLTNDVSLNYHKAISQGYFPERFSSLILAMITSESFADVQPALQDMLQWGHTSGYEVILGMAIGFLLSIENQQRPFSP